MIDLMAGASYGEKSLQKYKILPKGNLQLLPDSVSKRFQLESILAKNARNLSDGANVNFSLDFFARV